MAAIVHLVTPMNLLADPAIVVPGADGSDGALDVTTNQVIDLSLAATGRWDSPNVSNPGAGVYDPQRWAVVFKYSSVRVASNVVVTFKNHPSRAPVVWLIQDSGRIDGTVQLNGQDAQQNQVHAEPGPGGFRGGVGAYYPEKEGAGLGPGGGQAPDRDIFPFAYSGSYGTRYMDQQGQRPALTVGTVYGNTSIVPLIGGSGGAGSLNANIGGGAGGGAILIAAQKQLQINGSVLANGGNGGRWRQEHGHDGAVGSGGAIRLVAGVLEGSSGVLQAFSTGSFGYVGGRGRIRLERVEARDPFQVLPEPSVITLQNGSRATLWPPDDVPTVTVVSVGDFSVPDDPRGLLGALGADVSVQHAVQQRITVETTMAPTNAVVMVRSTPRFGAPLREVQATVEAVLGGPKQTILWRAEVPGHLGYSTIQATLKRP